MGMNVNLTPQLEDLVRRKVASRMYTSASEVVRAALRLMRNRTNCGRRVWRNCVTISKRGSTVGRASPGIPRRPSAWRARRSSPGGGGVA